MIRTAILASIAACACAAEVRTTFDDQPEGSSAIAGWKLESKKAGSGSRVVAAGAGRAFEIGVEVIYAGSATVPGAGTVVLAAQVKPAAADAQICLGLRGAAFPPAYELRIGGDGRVVLRRIPADGKESNLAEGKIEKPEGSWRLELVRDGAAVSLKAVHEGKTELSAADASPLDLGAEVRAHLRNWKNVPGGIVDDIVLESR